MFEREREVFMRKLFGKRMSKELGGIVKAWESTVRKSHIIAKKRANSFLPTMSVAHAEDEDEDEDEDHAIKVLPNGDMYNGQWADNCPHGQGKYLWTDGCMYFGEWFKGKTMGKGRFSWPSGATYEGEFKNGFMDGHGTYTGVGGTYKGCWVMNLKHGKGTKSYDNGDYYDGEWRKGMQDGQGRYQWENGNHYIGHWRKGLMNGNGTMIWANGNRYDGFWEGGLPKGNGTFRWVDGSFYVGFWSMDSKEQSGTYYPPGSEVGNLDWDPQEVLSICLNDCNICPGEKILTFPSQKMPDWCGAEGNGVRLRRMSADGRLNTGEVHSWGLDGYANGHTVDGNSGAGGEGEECLGTTPKLDGTDSSRPTISQQIRLQPARRQGETISKGHKNYELMLNLQLGIR